ncbi:MAG: hypothetical protein VX519_06440 [Myxococcota bacterium]|nr:hypothetical protein [Myxococcota bacterium]
MIAAVAVDSRAIAAYSAERYLAPMPKKANRPPGSGLTALEGRPPTPETTFGQVGACP